MSIYCRCFVYRISIPMKSNPDGNSSVGNASNYPGAMDMNTEAQRIPTPFIRIHFSQTILPEYVEIASRVQKSKDRYVLRQMPNLRI